MNTEKITIVTAFFPLKREEWNGFNRSNNKYLEYFKFWSKLKNDIIVYTDPIEAANIEKYIKESKRENIKLVILNNYKEIDEELYNSIKSTMSNENSVKFRFQPKNPESWNADYNYIMSIKSWCVQDAVNKGYATGMVAWIDFGFNHGGEYFIDESDFEQEWRYNFNEKFHLFMIHDLDSLPIFQVCEMMHTYIQGDIMVAPSYLWEEFWTLVRKNMLTLNKCGLADDDQTITLMAYREKPEIFELHKSTWFSPLRDCSNIKFKIKEENKKKNKFLKIKRQIKHRINLLKYLCDWYNVLKNEETKG